jgi:hypothetical protein
MGLAFKGASGEKLKVTERQSREAKPMFAMSLVVSLSVSYLESLNVGDGSHSWIAAGAEPDAHQFLCHDSF